MSKSKSMSVATLPLKCPASCRLCQPRPRWNRPGQQDRQSRLADGDLCHRKQQINSGSFQVKKIAHHVADVEIAFLVSFQNDVIPTRHTFAFGNSTEQVSRPIGKPFNL